MRSLGAVVGRTTVVRVLSAVLVMVSLAAWAVGSPVGSSPDEDFHLTSIWCGQGVRDGLCEEGGSPVSREVPAALHEARCYAFHPEESAACQGSSITDPDGRMLDTERGNFLGDYPPVFFSVMSVLVGDSIEGSVIAMRLLNAMIFVLFVAGAFVLATPALRRGLVLGVAVTFVPLGTFIVPSVNPSSWALTSAATVFVTCLVHLTANGRRRQLLSAGLLALAVGLGAGARGDAALYAGLSIGAALLVTLRADRRWVVRAVYPAVLACLSGIAFLTVGQSSAVEGTGAQVFSLGRVLRTVADVPALWAGALGSWGLGWLDTGMPALVWTVMFGLFMTVLVSGIRGIARPQGLAVAGAALAALLVPAYIQYLTGVPVGAYVQPRYVLPLMILLVLTVVCRVDGRAPTISTGQRWLAVGGMSAAHALALYSNIRRYVYGTDVESINLGVASEWWWSGGVPGPMVVWLLGSSAFAAGLVLLSRELVVQEVSVTPTAPTLRGDTAPAAPGVEVASTPGASDRSSGPESLR
ncbi:DUF2142 domain-containing protein [Actinotalea fermentans]|uniref:DUF2142 domain-containing protein n=1 Tax=Actinotalea fermentans TaxID=43671 RepID=UPI00051F3296|nr:DUF2142 domain-containing protein [Actinotalea fermentans]KGM16673.1 hypothetical protein N867_17490 [Actinotalea fermentans ATCC 43279 = JCM 9966 = DSM 3133]